MQRATSNKSKAKYLAVLGALTAPLCISSLNANATDVPLYLNQEATSINVTITDRVTFNLPADTNTATASSITVTNNLTSVPVVVSNIQATAETGYHLEAYSTNFSTYDADSNHFGIAYTESQTEHDISGTGYALAEEIAATGNHVFTFAGKSSAYSTAVEAASNTHIANIILTLGMKPVPQVSDYVTYMQDFATLSSADKATVLSIMADSTTYNLIDNRDNKTYQVAKMKDGNIWMAENLDLGRTDLTTDLTSSNTNLSTTVTAATFNSWKKTEGSYTYDAREFIPVEGTDATSGTPYGTLYDCYAASAGTISGSSNSSNAQYDICPAGWRLPTGGDTGEFRTLYREYHSTALMRAPIANGGAAFALAGGFQLGAPGSQGSGSYYWSSTRKTDTSMYALYLTGSNVYATHSTTRLNGYPIRCVAQ